MKKMSFRKRCLKLIVQASKKKKKQMKCANLLKLSYQRAPEELLHNKPEVHPDMKKSLKANLRKKIRWLRQLRRLAH